MTRGFLRLLVLSLVLCILFGCGITTSAFGRPRPAVSLSLTPAVNESAPIPFTWKGKRLGRNHRLVVQKPVGTAHVWKTVARLQTNSGSAQLAGLSLGRYRFRIADLIGRTVAAQQIASTNVYGIVPFTTLLRAQAQVATFPGYTFPYVIYAEGPYSSSPIFQVENNHCQSVHIAFVPTDYQESKVNTSGSITLVQESQEPVSVRVDFNAIGSLDANLVPGQSWAVNGERQENVHLNGYAVCSSAEPFASS
jgi:hypothetical protein